MERIQKHVVLPCKRLITSVKYHFPYIIHSFCYLLENMGAINYLYGLMDNIPDRIREQKPSLTDWSVISTDVMTMRRIVGSIFKNQASGGKWLISEEIVDTARVYIYCSGDQVGEVLKVALEQMAEEKDGLGEARQERRNLEETHMKMKEIVKSKLAKYPEPLLEVLSADKYHWWFASMLNPRYINEFTDARKLHEIETLDTRAIINVMIP